MDAVRGYIGIGLYFVVLALYWLVQATYTLEGKRRDGGKFRRWKFGFRSERNTGVLSPPCSPPDQSSLVPLDGCPASLWCVRLQRWPVESAFRFVLSLIAVASETAVSSIHGRLYDPTDVQRITVYVLFCLSGFVDFLQHFGVLYPAGTGQVLLTIAFTAEALFYNNSNPVESQSFELYRTLAVYSCLACVACIAAELFNRQQIGVRLLRSYLVLLHGTWMLHVGMLMLSEEWNAAPSSWVNVFFFWHVVGVFIFSSLLAAMLFWVKGQCRQGTFPPALPCWCSCTSVDDLNDGFRHTPSSDDLEETEPLALHP